ncbi:N-acetyltransferase family protein [Actinoplanes sp. NPDC004185]
MSLSFVLDPPLTDALRAEILALWTEVTNAGGAVGFVAPVRQDDVRPVAETALAGVAGGVDRLLIGVDGGRLVALLFIADNRFALKAHWRVLKRVMVRPGSQRRGYGAALMREAAAVASELGLAGLQVTVRDGHGLDGFYRRLGYREVGRIPGALRIAPGDDRDELLMWLALGQPQDAAFTAGSAAASATSPA